MLLAALTAYAYAQDQPTTDPVTTETSSEKKKWNDQVIKDAQNQIKIAQKALDDQMKAAKKESELQIKALQQTAKDLNNQLKTQMKSTKDAKK